MKINIMTESQVERMIEKSLKEVWKDINKLNEKLAKVERIARGIRFEI